MQERVTHWCFICCHPLDGQFSILVLICILHSNAEGMWSTLFMTHHRSATENWRKVVYQYPPETPGSSNAPAKEPAVVLCACRCATFGRKCCSRRCVHQRASPAKQPSEAYMAEAGEQHHWVISTTNQMHLAIHIIQPQWADGNLSVTAVNILCSRR